RRLAQVRQLPSKVFPVVKGQTFEQVHQVHDHLAGRELLMSDRRLDQIVPSPDRLQRILDAERAVGLAGVEPRAVMVLANALEPPPVEGSHLDAAAALGEGAVLAQTLAQLVPRRSREGHNKELRAALLSIVHVLAAPEQRMRLA